MSALKRSMQKTVGRKTGAIEDNTGPSVDADSHLVLARHLSQQPNDKQEVAPTLERLGQLPDALGQVDTLLADSGYFSEANAKRCEAEPGHAWHGISVRPTAAAPSDVASAAGARA